MSHSGRRKSPQVDTYQTHLVCKDTVLRNVPVMTEPVDAVDLERHKFELGSLTKLRLRLCGERLLLEPLRAGFHDSLFLVPRRHSDGLGEDESLEGIEVRSMTCLG